MSFRPHDNDDRNANQQQNDDISDYVHPYIKSFTHDFQQNKIMKIHTLFLIDWVSIHASPKPN